MVCCENLTWLFNVLISALCGTHLLISFLFPSLPFLLNSISWQPVINYIDSKCEDFLNAESRVNRRQMPDNRVHCCLYFIAPSGHGWVLQIHGMDVCYLSAEELQSKQ